MTWQFCAVSKFRPASGHPFHEQLGGFFFMCHTCMGTLEDFFNLLAVVGPAWGKGPPGVKPVSPIHNQAPNFYATLQICHWNCWLWHQTKLQAFYDMKNFITDPEYKFRGIFFFFACLRLWNHFNLMQYFEPLEIKTSYLTCIPKKWSSFKWSQG